MNRYTWFLVGCLKELSSWFVLSVGKLTLQSIIKMTNYLLGRQVSQDTLAPSSRGCVLWEWHLTIFKSIPRIPILQRQRWTGFYLFCLCIALLNTEGCIKQPKKSRYPQKQPADSEMQNHNLKYDPRGKVLLYKDLNFLLLKQNCPIEMFYWRS